jgi:ABC-type lipoprotein release transport system permease subunit
LFGVSTADALTLLVSVAVVICAGLLASAVPAARAARVPIAETIREN